MRRGRGSVSSFVFASVAGAEVGERGVSVDGWEGGETGRVVEEWREGGEDMLVAVVVGESGGRREVVRARFWRRVERKAVGSMDLG